MNKPPIPVPILKNLRCGHCRKSVTCGPVHVTPDSSILCGRCIRFAKRLFRNIALEAVASIFLYPCHYWPQHCNKKLVWNESLDHERNCIFQSSCNVFCSKPGTFFKSERKFPNNPEMNLAHVTEDILEQLKCLACESYLSNGPIYLVPDGKNICHRCHHSNGVPKGAIRNLALETIASALIFPCIYRFRGCTIRIKFGREMWGHESQCPYGKSFTKIAKKPSKTGGKERGVIETHSGHIWGTITPHSAPFAPPKTKNSDGKILTQELTEIMKNKSKVDESKNFDVQSMDSVASTFDSLADNISRSTGDNISRDNVSRDNVSRDNVSRSTVDNISRDNVSRASSRIPAHGSIGDNISRENVSRSSSRLVEDHRRHNSDMMIHEDYRPSVSGYPNQPGPPKYDIPRPYSKEVAPLPTPMGYNKISFNGYYQDNVAMYGRPSHFEQHPQLYNYAPYYDNNANLNYSNSFNYGHAPPTQIPPKRSESFRIGNQDLIDELKYRQNKKQTPNPTPQKGENPYGQCNNLQDIVQTHDEVFH